MLLKAYIVLVITGASVVNVGSDISTDCSVKCDDSIIQLDMVWPERDILAPLLCIEEFEILEPDLKRSINIERLSELTLEGHLPRKGKKWISIPQGDGRKTRWRDDISNSII